MRKKIDDGTCAKIPFKMIVLSRLERKLKETLIKPPPHRPVASFPRNGSQGWPSAEGRQDDGRKCVKGSRSQNGPVSPREVRRIGPDNEHAFSNQVPHCHPVFIVYHNTIHRRAFIASVSHYSRRIMPLCESAARSCLRLSFLPAYIFLPCPSLFCHPRLFRSSK